MRCEEDTAHQHAGLFLQAKQKSHLSAYITQRVARVFAKISQLLEIMIARLDAKISSPENCLCQMSIAGASE